MERYEGPIQAGMRFVDQVGIWGTVAAVEGGEVRWVEHRHQHASSIDFVRSRLRPVSNDADTKPGLITKSSSEVQQPFPNGAPFRVTGRSGPDVPWEGKTIRYARRPDGSPANGEPYVPGSGGREWPLHPEWERGQYDILERRTLLQIMLDAAGEHDRRKAQLSDANRSPVSPASQDARAAAGPVRAAPVTQEAIDHEVAEWDAEAFLRKWFGDPTLADGPRTGLARLLTAHGQRVARAERERFVERAQRAYAEITNIADPCSKCREAGDCDRCVALAKAERCAHELVEWARALPPAEPPPVARPVCDELPPSACPEPNNPQCRCPECIVAEEADAHLTPPVVPEKP